MKNTMKAMNDEALTLVTGGDEGDLEYEIASGKALYKVGDHVEVYKTPMHWFLTWGGTITKVKVEDKCPWYFIELDNGMYGWYYSDDIQRN